MDIVAEQQTKQRSRVRKESYFHIFGVLLLCGLTITIIVDFLKRKDKRTEKIIISVLALIYFAIPASIIIRQKYVAVKELDTEKLRHWIVWETFNMTVLTLFMGFGTTLILPPPFDFTTGTVLLMIIYWVPLFAYKAAQLFRIKKLILQIETSILPISVRDTVQDSTRGGVSPLHIIEGVPPSLHLGEWGS